MSGTDYGQCLDVMKCTAKSRHRYLYFLSWSATSAHVSNASSATKNPSNSLNVVLVLSIYLLSAFMRSPELLRRIRRTLCCSRRRVTLDVPNPSSSSSSLTSRLLLTSILAPSRNSDFSAESREYGAILDKARAAARRLYASTVKLTLVLYDHL